MLRLTIPQPCHEDWNKMTPNEQGAFCKVCAKTVVDFTQLSDDEVKNYFLAKRGERTCGKFNNTQLHQPPAIEVLLQQPLPLWKKFLAIVLFCFGGFLSSCNDGKMMGKMEVEVKPLQGEPEIETTVGYIMPAIIDTTKNNPGIIETVECTTTKGDVAPVIFGDIEITETIGITEIADPEDSVTGKVIIAPVAIGIPDSGNHVIEAKKECLPIIKNDTVFYKP